MREIKPSAKLQTLIEAYRKESTDRQGRETDANTATSELRVQLAEVRSRLDAAVDRSIVEPTDANEEAEHALRREEADLKLRLAGAEHRSTRAKGLGEQRLRELTQQVVDAAYREANAHYAANFDAKARAVADAKLAYLNALADCRDLWMTSYRFAQSTVAGVGRDLDTSRLNKRELNHKYRYGERQIYGINEWEFDNAYNKGTIHRASVEEGKSRG